MDLTRPRLCLLTIGAATALSAPAHADDTEALAAARALPGLSAVADQVSLTASGSGYELAIAGAADVRGAMFAGAAGWSAALALPPRQLALGALDGLGTLTVSTAVVVISPQGGAVQVDTLPSTFATALAPFGSTLTLTSGVNLFVAATPGDDGVLGQLRGALGGGAAVQVTGAVGADVIAHALGAGDQGAPAGDLALTVTLPSGLIPPPLHASTPELQRLFHVVVSRASLTVARRGGAVTFGGDVTARVTVRGVTATLTGALAVTRGGTTTKLTIASAATARTPIKVPDLLLQDDPRLKLRLTRLGFDTTLVRTSAGTSGALALAATVKLPDGTELTGKLEAVASTGGGMQELSLELVGSLPVTNPGGDEALTITDPKVGLLVASKGAYVSGAVTWRGLTAKALVWGQVAPVGLSVFLDLPSAKLSAIVGASVPFDPQLPDAVVVLSSVDLAGVPLDRMPTVAGEMLARLDQQQLTIGKGLGVIAKLDTKALDATRRDELAKAGITGRYTIGGAIGVDGARPTFTLYADLPKFKVPRAWADKLPAPLPSVTPRLFFALTGGATPAMQLGAEVTFGDWKLDGVNEIDLASRVFVSVGAGSPSLQLTGKLVTDWNDPFYLTGITIERDTGLSLAFSADSARVMMNGNVRFDGLRYGLGGGASVQWATGVPTPRGLALRLSASELGLLAAAKVGQTVIRAGANLARTLVDETGAPLPSAIKTALATAKTADIVGAVRGVLPASGPAAQLTAFSLKDVELFLATPGMADPDFPDLDDVGVKIKGKLLNGTKQLAAIDAFLTTKLGFQLKASTASFAIGPLSIVEPKIDLGAGIPGVHQIAPHFDVSGKVTLEGFSLADLAIALSTSEIRVAGKVDTCGGADKCLGGMVALTGHVTGPSDARLTGKADLNPPKIGFVNLGEFEASFTLDTGGGLAFTGSKKWENARFSLSGSFTSPGAWKITGSSSADTGSKSFKFLEVKVIELKVNSGTLALSLSPTKATVRAKGGASIDPIGFKAFGWSYDQELDADLEITKRVNLKVEIAGIKYEESIKIKYRIFPND